jgi:hypothetical protein
VAKNSEDGYWGPEERPFLQTLDVKIIEAITENWYHQDEEFRIFAIDLGYTEEKMAVLRSQAEELVAEKRYALCKFYEENIQLAQYFDRWVVVRDTPEGKVGEIVLQKRTESHVETNLWGQS